MRRYVLVFCALAACTLVDGPSPVPLGSAEPTLFTYTPPEDSGLVGVRPYPMPDDVCIVIGENEATQAFLDDAALLIGCPKHEFGAIEDRLAEGARLVAHREHWSLFSIPER